MIIKRSMHVLLQSACLYARACVYERVQCAEAWAGHLKYQSCWCSLSDAEDILQPAFIPDLANGRRRIYVIQRVSYLSDQQALFLFLQDFLAVRVV